MRWVGKEVDRVGRGGRVVDLSETRWLVPVRPYQAPKGSIERAETMILMGVGVAAIIFTFTLMVLSAV